MLLGSLVTVSLFIFTFPTKTYSASVFLLAFYYAKSEIFLPFALPFLFYAFFMQKRSTFEMHTFFPFTVAFYSVYFPYISIMNHVRPFFFDLFVKPIYYLILIFFIQTILLSFDKIQKLSNLKKILLTSFVLSFPFLPAFYHAGLYLFGIFFLVIQILLIFFIWVKLCKTKYY